MNSTITTSNKKYFTISLTKAELDSIQKQFLEELDEMLNRIRRKNNNKLAQSESFPPCPLTRLDQLTNAFINKRRSVDK